MTRSETIKAERRRRNTDALGGQRRKLTHGEVDRENFAYRWVNDVGNRVQDLTVNDDWEVVHDRSGTLKVDGTGTGTEVSAHVGNGDNGRPMRALLLRKKKDWYEDDKMAAQRRIDETEAAIKQGATPGVDGEGLRQTREGIQLQHGSRP